MSWVEKILDSLGVTRGEIGRDRIWAVCPWHQPPDAPASWATTFFVRTKGTRTKKGGGQYSAAGQCHCFACGGGGSIRDLVMKVRGCSEEEASKFVRARGAPSGSKVEEVRRRVVVTRAERGGRTSFEMPREVVFEPLDRWVSAAREEVTRRGITAEEVERYGIGYAVDGAKLGGRVVVPWRDYWGRIGSYTARTFIGDGRKYTTPSAAENPDRDVVFGEHLWPAREVRRVVVVTEGAFNAMAAARAMPGISVGAVGGADNYNAGQATRLSTFERALVLSDPDAAGDKLALALEMTLGRYVDVERVRLPRGEDAEDVGEERLRAALSDALARLVRASAP